MMIREHLKPIVWNDSKPTDAAVKDSCALMWQMYDVARLIDAYDALRTDLAAAEHLLHEAQTGAEQVNAELAALRSELAAATERLWKTADGVYAIPGDAVYHPSTSSVGSCGGKTSTITQERYLKGHRFTAWLSVPTSECYSSREAMEAAKGGA